MKTTDILGHALATLYMVDALAFLNASKKLNLGEDYSPKYYLIIHAIELIGKSFLLAKDDSPSSVLDIRHDLIKLFDRCGRHGLQLEHPRTRDILDHIAPVHLDHRLRYARLGSTTLPSNSELEDFCVDLLNKTWPTLRAMPSDWPDDPPV
jgi:hypothetical protein